jgi:hypothetical protein
MFKESSKEGIHLIFNDFFFKCRTFFLQLAQLVFNGRFLRFFLKLLNHSGIIRNIRLRMCDQGEESFDIGASKKLADFQ